MTHMTCINKLTTLQLRDRREGHSLDESRRRYRGGGEKETKSTSKELDNSGRIQRAEPPTQTDAQTTSNHPLTPRSFPLYEVSVGLCPTLC